MKKCFCLLYAVFLMLPLSACGEPPTVQNEFAASFTVRQGDADYAGTLQIEGDLLTVSMSSPHTVNGITFCYQGSELRIQCAQHSTNANADYLPENSVPSVLHNTLSYLSQATYTASENGKDSFSLPTPYGDAALTAKDGVPLSLTDPHSGLEFAFSLG